MKQLSCWLHLSQTAATFPEDWKVVGIAYILKLILEVIQETTVNDLDMGIWSSW